eukprot:364510-Chlamydomonas_euryale.AAC.3
MSWSKNSLRSNNSRRTGRSETHLKAPGSGRVPAYSHTKLPWFAWCRRGIWVKPPYWLTQTRD